MKYVSDAVMKYLYSSDKLIYSSADRQKTSTGCTVFALRDLKVLAQNMFQGNRRWFDASLKSQLHSHAIDETNPSLWPMCHESQNKKRGDIHLVGEKRSKALRGFGPLRTRSADDEFVKVAIYGMKLVLRVLKEIKGRKSVVKKGC